MIRIVVAAPSALACDALALALGAESDLQVAAKAITADQAIARCREGHVVVASMELPEGGAMEIVRQLPKRVPGARTVVTGVPGSAGIALEYLEAGAAGLVPRAASMAELVQHVRAAAEGRPSLAPEVTHLVLNRLVDLARTCDENQVDVARMGELTPREVEVLDRLEAGASNQEIARALGIGLGTVKNHVHSVLTKLGLESREDAAIYARLARRRSS